MKRVRIFTVVILILSFTQLSLAQRPPIEFKIHNIGNLWTATTNYGKYGDPNGVSTGRPSFEWPKESGNDYVYDSGLWIGAIVNEDTMVTHVYYYGEYEWLPSEGSVFLIGNEVPDPKSDQDSKAEFDDFDPSVHSTGPLNIRVFQRGMVWTKADYNDFIIYEYYIVNESIDTLEQLYISWWFDCDVGTGADPSSPHIDDLVGWDTTDQFSYMWDGDDSTTVYDDTGEFDSTSHQFKAPGYIGQKLLNSPTGSISSHYYFSWENEPVSDGLKYEYMSSGEYLPDPEDEYDWRWLQSTGPFTINQGDTLHIVTGISIGMGLEGLRQNISRMVDVYENNLDTEGLPDPAPTAPFGFHGEAKEDTAYLYWTHNVETDLMGYNIYRDFQLLTYLSPEETDFLDAITFGNEHTYAITAVDSNGSEGSSSYVTIMFTGIVDQDDKVPTSYKLLQNHPNPFNSSTKISYSIPNSDFITLKIYDLLGRETQTLVGEFQDSGTYSVNFDASKLSSGIYFYRLQVGSDFVETKKMLLLR